VSAKRSGGSQSGRGATSHTLGELQSRSDQAATWISDNPLLILAAMGAVLVLAAVWGLVSSAQQTAATDASIALAGVEREYRSAMGARQGQVDIPEPANPEAARSAREQAIQGYAGVISNHSGSVSAAVAALHRAGLQHDIGLDDDALGTLTAAVAEADSSLQALLLSRIAGLHEAAGRFGEAADAHEQAAAIPSYPLRHSELGEAARCRALAGDADAAVALLQRLEAEAPNLQLAPHVSAQLKELRALRSQ
jgi:predicted negative regulator of RcsB-dependent stress response